MDFDILCRFLYFYGVLCRHDGVNVDSITKRSLLFSFEVQLYFIEWRSNVHCYLFRVRHIIVGGKTEVFETWKSDWMCGLNELTGDPTTDGPKLVLKLPVR